MGLEQPIIDRVVKKTGIIHKCLPYAPDDFMDDPIYVAHNGGKETPAFQYLLESGVNPVQASRLIDALHEGPHDQMGKLNPYALERYLNNPRNSQTNLAKQVRDFWMKYAGETQPVSDFNPYQLDLSDLKRLMDIRLSPVFEAVNPSLNASSDLGFHQHGKSHVEQVTAQSLTLLALRQRLLYRRGIPKDRREHEHMILVRAIIKGMGHDLGNVLSRKVHEALSPQILATLIPELLCDQKQWDLIVEGIMYHNDTWLEFLFEQERAATRAQEVEILKRFSPDALALLVADISQSAGRDRVSSKPTSPEAIGEDWHLALSLLFQYGELELSPDGRSLVWPLSFTPGIAQEEQPVLDRFARPGKQTEVAVPAVVHELHRQHGVPHFNTAEAKFYNLYFDKIVLMAEAAFALYPTLEKFYITMTDLVEGSAGGTQITEIITRAMLETDVARLAKKYEVKAKRQKWVQE